MENNHYNNIIAPSDGVRRFLCKTSVLFVGLVTAVYCAFAFRMNMIEHTTLGGSLRSTMLYAAYVMVPLGMVTAAVFARIKSMGLAFSMISLLVATGGMFMLFLNAIASLLREYRLQGIACSLLELLMFAAALAVLVNLVMSCMDFRIVPWLGTAGAVMAVLAMAIAAVRTATSYSAMPFAWDQAFDWKNMAEQVTADKLTYQAKWIFRSIPMSSPMVRTMFWARFHERVAACVFYGFCVLLFLKYKNEMKLFNKLMAHAREYVDIPTARILASLSKPEEPAGKPSSGGSSLRSRLRDLTRMTKAKEQGLDITEMSEQYDREVNVEGDDEAPVQKRQRRAEGYDEERRPQRQPRPEGYDEERRPKRQRRPEGYDEERRPQRQRRPEGYDEERRPKRQRRPEDYDEERRPQRQRRPEGYDEERRLRRQRRPEGYDEERRPQRQRRPESFDEELTDEEKYLIEERRRRNPTAEQTPHSRSASRTDRMDYRRRRKERIRNNDEDLQRSLNNYYNNYMQIREERNQSSRFNDGE